VLIRTELDNAKGISSHDAGHHAGRRRAATAGGAASAVVRENNADYVFVAEGQGRSACARSLWAEEGGGRVVLPA
jgi:hypothetical protein